MKQKKLASEELAFRVYAQIITASPEKLGKLNVNMLANLNGVSPANLSRAFRKYCLTKLSSFLEKRKIKVFEEIIRENPYTPIKKVLKQLDIESSSHFGERYKKYRQDGMPPSFYVLECQLERIRKLRTKS